MQRILVTYYSRDGKTQTMAEALAEGVRSNGVEVDVLPIAEVKPAALERYHGFIVGSPSYYGQMAGEVKRFFDRSAASHGHLVTRVGAAFSSCNRPGGGAETTVRGILDCMLIHGMVVQGDPRNGTFGPVAVGEPDERTLRACHEVGRRTAALTKMLFV